MYKRLKLFIHLIWGISGNVARTIFFLCVTDKLKSSTAAGKRLMLSLRLTRQHILDLISETLVQMFAAVNMV